MVNRPPYSRGLGYSDKYSVEDMSESMIRSIVKNSTEVWECENGHVNFTRFREGRNQSVSCSKCSERYRL